MARADRRFTPEDIARLYCNNIPDASRGVAQALMDMCATPVDDGVDPDVKLVRDLLEYMGDYMFELIPFDKLVKQTALYLLNGIIQLIDGDMSTNDQIEDYLGGFLLT